MGSYTYSFCFQNFQLLAKIDHKIGVCWHSKHFKNMKNMSSIFCRCDCDAEILFPKNYCSFGSFLTGPEVANDLFLSFDGGGIVHSTTSQFHKFIYSQPNEHVK